MEFARRYGRVDKIITERESAATTAASRRQDAQAARPSAGHHADALRPAPDRQHGFLSLKDVAEDLPLYNEYLDARRQ